MKERSILDICMRICFGVMVFFFTTILIRFGTRHILEEKRGWNNAFTRAVFFDEPKTEEVSDQQDENDTTTVEIDWEELYPFAEGDVETVREEESTTLLTTYESAVKMAENIITRYAEDYLLGYMQFTRTGKSYNGLIGCDGMNVNEGVQVIPMNNGYLAYTAVRVSDEELTALADHISDYAKYLDSLGVGFVYANTGSKVCRYDKQLPVWANENTNENADKLIELLHERNVDVLDYRPLQEERYPDWYSSYYITDHHWKTTTQLWAAGVLADHLNTHDGFDFDPEMFDEKNYHLEERERYFFGGQGRALTTAMADLESFTKVTPAFETDFTVQIPTRGIDIRGDYRHTLFRDDFYESIRDYSLADFETKEDTYHAVLWKGDALGYVDNHIAPDNQGKKILMIEDSFGWYLSTFLATDIPRIDYLFLGTYNGSLRSYVEQTRPDVVVLLLCEKNINGIRGAEFK